MSLSSSNKEIAENIKVFVRERPTLSSDPVDDVNSVNQNGIKNISDDLTSCKYFNSTSNVHHTFKLDKFFPGPSDQEALYNTIAAPIVSSALQGYSGTIFAYGPTSSGKTYTMRGGEGNKEGIIPRCLNDLFAKSDAQKTEIWISYLQIYCEQITDLLNTNSGDPALDSAHHLTIRERGGNVFVEGLNRFRITSVAEFWSIFLPGDANRNTASTNKNETSSRSHAALMVHVILKEGGGSDAAGSSSSSYRESTLVLVDLAGSERFTASEGRDLMRLEEAKSINLSLSALGNCMSALAEDRGHIPYRDSKLTRLLQGSLGGSARTAVIVNIAPGADDTGEVLNALRFASRASKIKVMAKIGRYIDYESMYKDARKKLEMIEKQSGAGSVADELTEKLKHKDLIIEQKNVEIEQLREQLKLATAASAAGATTLPSAGAKGGGAGGCSAANASAAADMPTSQNVDDINAFWQNKLKVVTTEHLAVMDSSNKASLSRLKRAQSAIEELNAAISSLQDDLNFERQRHLGTVQELRQAHEKRVHGESELKERVDELLVELSDRRSNIEDLIAALEEMKARAESAEEEAESKYRDYVSREQVKEMENLFLETVTKLTDRVRGLESSRSRGSTPNNNNASNSNEGGSGFGAFAVSGGGGGGNNNSRSAVGGGGGGGNGRQQQQAAYYGSNSNSCSKSGGSSSSSSSSSGSSAKQPHQPFQPRYMQTVKMPTAGAVGIGGGLGKGGARMEPGKIRPGSLWSSAVEQPSLAAVGTQAKTSPRTSPQKPGASGTNASSSVTTVSSSGANNGSDNNNSSNSNSNSGLAVTVSNTSGQQGEKSPFTDDL